MSLPFLKRTNAVTMLELHVKNYKVLLKAIKQNLTNTLSWS